VHPSWWPLRLEALNEFHVLRIWKQETLSLYSSAIQGWPTLHQGPASSWLSSFIANKTNVLRGENGEQCWAETQRQLNVDLQPPQVDSYQPLTLLPAGYADLIHLDAPSLSCQPPGEPIENHSHRPVI
jgi:hypothetical protein